MARDSMTTVSEYAEMVPAVSATTSIALESLRSLPEGASFGVRQGRISLSASRQGDSLVLSSYSDSLQRRCMRLEQRAYREQLRSDSLTRYLHTQAEALQQREVQAQEVQEQQTQQRRTTSWWRYLTAGVALGVVLSILWRRRGWGERLQRLITNTLALWKKMK